MQLSARVSALKPSTTLAINAKAKALQAQGIPVLSFAAGEPDFDTPVAIKQALIEALNKGETKYCPVPGDAATRRVIADKLTGENGLPNVTPEHVVISSGGKQSLYQVFQALLETPSEVILPTPAWVSYAPQIELAGGKVLEVVTTAASGFKMTPDQLRGAITARSRALVINSPSNPCGTMYSPDEIRAIAQVVAEHPNLIVISDELYEKIIFGGIPHFSMGSIPEIAERVVTVNGLSKAYAMTGWRIGYCAGSGEFGLQLSKALQSLQSQSTTSIATFELPAIRVALTECADEVEAMRQAFARRAEVTYSLIARVPGLVCPKPTGAFYVFPDASAHFGKRTPGGKTIASASDFAAALLDEHRVAVVPGEDFGAGGEKCFRLSFACGDEQIRDGVGRIGEFVASLR
jgi:aspartate aminotransferase